MTILVVAVPRTSTLVLRHLVQIHQLLSMTKDIVIDSGVDEAWHGGFGGFLPS